MTTNNLQKKLLVKENENVPKENVRKNHANIYIYINIHISIYML